MWCEERTRNIPKSNRCSSVPSEVKASCCTPRWYLRILVLPEQTHFLSMRGVKLFKEWSNKSWSWRSADLLLKWSTTLLMWYNWDYWRLPFTRLMQPKDWYPSKSSQILPVSRSLECGFNKYCWFLHSWQHWLTGKCRRNDWDNSAYWLLKKFMRWWNYKMDWFSLRFFCYCMKMIVHSRRKFEKCPGLLCFFQEMPDRTTELVGCWPRSLTKVEQPDVKN